jgi:hypothetical protein
MNHGFDGPASPELIAQLTDYSITLAGANPYGEVMDGWIELSAPMFGLDHRLLPPDPYFRILITGYTADQFARAQAVFPRVRFTQLVVRGKVEATIGTKLLRSSGIGSISHRHRLA